MKTPQEIKKGLGCCSPENGFAPFYNDCSYKKEKWCADTGNVDALAYIRQIEADNVSKDERIQMLETGIEQWHGVAYQNCFLTIS